MTAPIGLRERKKAKTRSAISAAAITMFLERGYDRVSVAEIAAAAEVTKSTVFVYFPSKDDLALHRIADHVDQSARVVRGRRTDQSPLDALEEMFLSQLDARDAISGLSDRPEVIAYSRMVIETPSLATALNRYQERSTRLLAAALEEASPSLTAMTSRLAACQISAVQFLLIRANQERVVGGAAPDSVAAEARQDALTAFESLRNGLRL
ncbi:TetR/AcrR family transcriptional regulator [Streptomyces sp. NPDC001288]|uniref:TetR/AcrR family transcriptional regulator n=1 Tax=unclassified Streptomyces TaxID=2593676 RepID=UPI003332F8D1